MAAVYADLQLANGLSGGNPPVAVRARVDMGERHMLLPARVAGLLGVSVRDRRFITTLAGEARSVEYAGPVRVEFGDRRCWMGALVVGDEVVLGTMAIDSMDLVVDPALQTLTVHPSSPCIARSLAVGVRTVNP